MGRGGTVTLLQQALRPGTGTEYEAARREERLGMQEAEVRQTNGRCVVASALGLAEIVHNEDLEIFGKFCNLATLG